MTACLANPGLRVDVLSTLGRGPPAHGGTRGRRHGNDPSASLSGGSSDSGGLTTGPQCRRCAVISSGRVVVDDDRGVILGLEAWHGEPPPHHGDSDGRHQTRHATDRKMDRSPDELLHPFGGGRCAGLRVTIGVLRERRRFDAR